MKKIRYFLITIGFFFISCEEVIDVDLGSAQPKLVVDAYLKWNKGTSGNQQLIRLSMTAPYFSEEVPPATGAIVTVTNADGDVFNFIEDGLTGFYLCNDFVPVLNTEYFLTVIYNETVYEASEIMKSVPDITSVEQDAEGGFTGDEIEVRAFFTDDAATTDYYLFRFKPDHYEIPFYDVVEDRFFNGNEIFALYSDDELETDSGLSISIFGISQRYYNYMNILTSIAGGNGGSPFQSPPATVRGNVLNTTHPDDYPLGYFALSEVDSVNYIVE